MKEIDHASFLAFDKEMKEFDKVIRKEKREEKRFKNYYKKLLKGKINISGLWKNLDDEMSSWTPVGIVNIKLTDEKQSGYSTYQHARVESYLTGIVMRNNDTYKDNYLYMKTPCDDIRGVDHYYVWQRTGCCEDDYYGYLLFPLKDGMYFKISYSC
jgi:hypothetical protein